MELRHLRYFVAAAREEHFGRAAKKLGVAQPALSRRIADVEAEIGVKLFERLKRGVRLSPAGRAFFGDIAPVLDEIERAVVKVKRSGSAQGSKLILGFSEIASSHGVIPAALRAFRAFAPAVEIELVTIGSIAQLKALQDGSIDAAIVYDVHLEPGALAAFEHHTLDRSVIVAALPREQRLARRKSLRAADLANEPIVWLRREGAPRLHERLMSACMQAGLTPDIVQETATYSSLLSLVSAGMGIGFVGSEAAGGAHESVVFKAVADIQLDFRVELLWRKGANSTAVDTFVSFIKSRALLSAYASSGK